MIGRLRKLLLPLLTGSLLGAGASAQSSLVPPPADAATPSAASVADEVRVRLFGRSGRLRVMVLKRSEGVDPALLEAAIGRPGARFRWTPLYARETGLLGTPAFTGEPHAPEAAGVWQLEVEHAPTTRLTAVTEVPFSEKRGGMLNGYHIGTYPTEGSERDDAYAAPSGFVEVTAESQDLRISEHFTFRQFLTKDQGMVWPKYVALRLELVDKLELVLQELARMGIRADRMHVMSGYRTPQYNGPGGDGRAALSRHMYGDAADVWVDSDGDGWIDDLNGDGRRDTRDVDVMLRAVERVERKHPELLGGAGLYRDSDTHGPFLHVDVRGTRVRW